MAKREKSEEITEAILPELKLPKLDSMFAEQDRKLTDWCNEQQKAIEKTFAPFDAAVEKLFCGRIKL